MMMPYLSAFRLRQALTGLSATGMLLLSGCGLGTTASPVTSFSESAVVSGTVHGGQQPVSGSVVRLYSAGTSGYGAGSTLLATSAATGATGSFSFTKLSTTGGTISGGSTPVWQCPATGDPQIYITAIGGNPGLTAGTNNTAIGLLAAIGACSGVTSQTQVGLNEISTVASVFALAQYINPGATAGAETLGTSATAQGTIGLNNAFANIANMADIANGAIVGSSSYAGSGTAAGVTVSATAESAKVVTIANILAACINTSGPTSSQCADLFASAAPPPAASVTSLPTATFAAASDTIQAAYYMAVNPINAGTFTSCNDGGTTKTACLFNLSPSIAPFAGGLTSAPLDWTIGITYSATGTCTNTDALFAGPAKVAIDASGNIWILNSSSSGGSSSIVELTPAGAPIVCVGAQANGRGLAIDPTGNVWAAFNQSSITNDILEIPFGTSTTVTWTPTVNPSTLVSDAAGNIFYTTTATGGSVYEIVAPKTNTTPYAAGLVTSGFNGTAATTLGYLAADPTGRIWLSNTTTSNLYAMVPTTAAITAYSVSGGTVTFTAANSFAVGKAAAISGLTTGTQFNNSVLTITAATATTFSATTTVADTPNTSDSGSATVYANSTTALPTTGYGVAIDAGNFVYTGTTCCGSSNTYKEAVKVTPGSGTAAGTLSGSGPYLGGNTGFRGTTLDGAGNQWFTNEYPETGTAINSGTYGVGEVYATGSGTTAAFTALSPTGTALASASCTTSIGCPTNGGFQKASLGVATDIAIDLSGNVWIPTAGLINTAGSSTITYSGTTVTEIVGAAVPTVTPLAVAAKNNTLATKP